MPNPKSPIAPWPTESFQSGHMGPVKPANVVEAGRILDRAWEQREAGTMSELEYNIQSDLCRKVTDNDMNPFGDKSPGESSSGVFGGILRDATFGATGVKAKPPTPQQHGGSAAAKPAEPLIGPVKRSY